MTAAIGGLLVILGCGAGGFLAAGELAARQRFLTAMERAACRMRGEIGDLGTPLPELMQLLCRDAEAGLFFQIAGDIATGDREAAWAKAVATAMRKYHLSEADVLALRRLGEGLGMYGLSDQLRRLSVAETELAHRAVAAAELREKYAKLLRFGGFAVGVSAALLI